MTWLGLYLKCKKRNKQLNKGHHDVVNRINNISLWILIYYIYIVVVHLEQVVDSISQENLSNFGQTSNACLHWWSYMEWHPPAKQQENVSQALLHAFDSTSIEQARLTRFTVEHGVRSSQKLFQQPNKDEKRQNDRQMMIHY